MYPLLIYSLVENFFLVLFLFVSISKLNNFLEQYRQKFKWKSLKNIQPRTFVPITPTGKSVQKYLQMKIKNNTINI